MQNNFEQIQKLLTFDSPDTFYVVQVAKQVEDKDIEILREFRVDTSTSLDSLQKSIIEMCFMNGASAYIYLNRRSYRKAALKTLSKISSLVAEENYDLVDSAFSEACLEDHAEESPRWALELYDFTEEEDHFVQGVLGALEPEGPKVKASVPGAPGSLTLVTTTFDDDFFFEKYHEIWEAAKPLYLEKDAQVLLFHP
jgi:hypothetical protein